MEKIGAIIVFYNPDEDRTRQVLDKVAPQVDAICVIDNSDQGNYRHLVADLPQVTYIPMQGNRGIAAAQNVGLHHFEQEGFDFILFVDQDTMCEPDTVERLFASWKWIDSQGIKVGAVAPIAVNHGTGQAATYNIARLSEWQEGDHHFLEVIHTMSSFSLIRLSLFREVGYMWEDLFIDAVDCEWCWRAKDKIGARFFYDCDVRMDHILGMGDKKIAGRNIHITSPFRMYYSYRNFIWLLHKSYVPGRWLRINAVKYVCKIGYYLIIGPNRWQYAKQIARGICDGIKGYKAND